ncbi:MAG: thioredoxin [Candidatus Riflebacteria bacterium]|nr:thioredoxin [Candidatus Riflebacteria bacterium]
MATPTPTGPATAAHPSRLPWAFLAAGLALMLGGIWLGETARILDKATQVCLQCIGIG